MLKVMNYAMTQYALIDCKPEDLAAILPMFGVNLPVKGRQIGDRVAYAFPPIPHGAAEEVSINVLCSSK